MISFTRINEKSLLVVALILVWASLQTRPLVIASPLLKSSLTSNTQLESKSGNSGSPSEYVEVEEEGPINLDGLNKLVASQPQIRLLRENAYDSRDVDDVPVAAIWSRTNDPLDSQCPRLTRILEQYIVSGRANRLPRRLSGTSKRAGKARRTTAHFSFNYLIDFSLHSRYGRRFARLHSAHQQGKKL